MQRFRKYIGDHWFDLGVELLDDCDQGELDTIEQKFPLNAKRCCTKMFQLWLSRCTSASWDDFIHALQAIELSNVAAIVSRFYGMYVAKYILYECKYYRVMFCMLLSPRALGV